ncbi:MAG: CdaR family protein [Bacteroidota bacterium]
MDPEENSKKSLERIYRKLKEKLFNRDVAVFSFFLLLSFIFWFINALSKNNTGSINFPVRYINFPENLALVNELPDRLSLEVVGPGYSVLTARISGNKTPLVIDVNNAGLSVKDRETELEFYIYSYNLRDAFSRQIRSDFDINSITPDTINFVFDKVIRKKVPVRPDVKVNTQRQFMINGNIVSDPDSVEISGPRAVIDTIDHVKTEYHEYNQVKEEITRNINIESIPKVGISHKKTEITIPVEQFTEEIIEVPVRILNEPDTAKVRLFPDMVNVHFNIALDDYNRIQEIPLEAVVDMHGIDVRKVERLTVKLVKLPDFISNVRYNPKRVEYIIEKK